MIRTNYRIQFHLKMNKKFTVILLLFFALRSIAQINEKDLPPRPSPPRLVNDLAEVLLPYQEQELEQKLVAFDDSTSTQIAIITLKSTGRYAIEDYALYLGRFWGVGQKDMDNGVVILAAIDDRRVTIQVGYGIEAYITDGRAKRIIENYILPEFKNGNYNAGLDAGAMQVMAYVSGQFDPLEDQLADEFDWKKMIPVIIIVLLILYFMGRAGGGGGVTYTGRGPTYWGGGWMGRGGGGFGGGGGGFGGFGGGGFGGGGASGGW